MKNFKEIAEKCAAGELYGTIILNDGSEFYSKYLSQYIFNGQIVEDFYTIGLAQHLFHVDQIINFIPNNMQEQIKIDVPEGKVPVMEQTEKGMVITWKEKELTYTELSNEFRNNLECIHSSLINAASRDFYKKVEVLRKLTNIRNYFGKPENMSEGWCITYSKQYNTFSVNYINDADRWFSGILFKKGEHAEQAIKMLGDELKYLFEPW